MTRFKSNSLANGSFFLIFLFILFFTLLLGQGLGRFYLGNITREVSAETLSRSISSSRGSNLPKEDNHKMKVLRLKQTEYYSILVATFEERETALKVGKELGQKGLPVIVTSKSQREEGGAEKGSFQVLLGLASNETALASLADQIQVGAQKAIVQKDYLNLVAYKFSAEDTFSAEKIAPYLGEISLCLEKGLLLYQSTKIQGKEFLLLRPKFSELAASLEQVAKQGETIKLERTDVTGTGLGSLAELCVQWAQSLHEVEKEWTDLALLKSQQQALVLIGEYHRYINLSN